MVCLTTLWPESGRGGETPQQRGFATAAPTLSFIRTVTVGPGISPGLLTPLAAERALAGSCVVAIPPVGNFAPP